MCDQRYPSIDALSRSLEPSVPEAYRLIAAKKVVAQARQEGGWIENDHANRANRLAQQLAGSQMLPTINMSGTVLHTGLGRARLAPAACEAVRIAAEQHVALEYDIESGQRGSRQSHVEWLLQDLTGAEAALVVNNCAAALVLSLAALAKGREVVVSRTQMVQIGGGFRIPDIVNESGCNMVEVGCTNMVNGGDFTNAVTDRTAAFLRCHRSNFTLNGFVSEPSPSELASTAHAHGLVCIDDLGSGCLIETSQYGLPKERTLREALQDGADVVLASGDKLLGGPQAGLILGNQEVVAKIAKHPLARAFRIDKLDLAALEATLRLYREKREREIPVWKYTSRSISDVRADAEFLQKSWPGSDIVESITEIGGGSLPGVGVPTACLTIDAHDLDNLHQRIRCEGRIVGSIREGLLWLDPRTAEAEEVARTAEFLKSIAP